jgi:hypothetical protein
MRRVVSLFAAAVFADRNATAADYPDARDAAKPCRPTISCTAEIAAPGTLELESGVLASKLGDGTRSLSIPFLLKETVARFLQLQVGSNGYTTTTSSPRARYLDNVAVGAKLHLVDQHGFLPALALSAAWGIPTFAATGYTRNEDAFFTGYASKDVGPIHVDLNAGANVYRLEAPRTQALGAIALSGGIPETPFGLAVEAYAFSDASPVQQRDGGVRGCVLLTPRPWLVFDVGGDAGLVASTRAYSAFFGATIIPVVFWRASGGGS